MLQSTGCAETFHHPRALSARNPDYIFFVAAPFRVHPRVHVIAQPPLPRPLSQRPRGHPPRDPDRPLRPQLAGHRPQQAAHVTRHGFEELLSSRRDPAKQQHFDTGLVLINKQ